MTYNNTNYEFGDVDSVTVEDPETVKLTRGSNNKNKTGLVYTEGGKDPKRVTINSLGVTAEQNAMLRTVFESKARVDFSVIDRTDGSGKIAKNAIISQMPQQLTIDESPDSMTVGIILETFDLKENHKS